MNDIVLMDYFGKQFETEKVGNLENTVDRLIVTQVRVIFNEKELFINNSNEGSRKIKYSVLFKHSQLQCNAENSLCMLEKTKICSRILESSALQPHKGYEKKNLFLSALIYRINCSTLMLGLAK